MPRKHRRTWLIIGCTAAGLLGSAILVGARLAAIHYARPLTFSPATVEPAPVAIVFGAGLTRSGLPTPVLQDRVTAAADLYFAGKVQKILMSGDNRFANYNEPAAMRAWALHLGVPDQAIVLDYAGQSALIHRRDGKENLAAQRVVPAHAERARPAAFPAANLGYTNLMIRHGLFLRLNSKGASRLSET